MRGSSSSQSSLQTGGSIFADAAATFQLPDSPLVAQWDNHSSLASVPDAVNNILGAFFEHAAAEFNDIDTEFNLTVKELKNFVMGGGKRVRPTFAWAGFRAGLEGGGATVSADVRPARVLTALTALEFVQACALIHDDIIDESDTRRGNPTVHRVFEARHHDHGWSGPASHYGMSQAILTGDLALSWADDLLNMVDLPAEMMQRVRRPWRAMRTEVIAGQQLDITAENNRSESLADAFKVIRFKTASYTVARPLHIGAALAGADERTVDLLFEYGHLVGKAFQLRDDQLGVFGDPAVTGKPSGDDLRTGKRTALVDFALELTAGTAANAEFRSSFGPRPDGSEHSEADIDRMRTLINDSGAADKVEQLISQASQKAISMVEESWLDESIKQELVAFAQRLSSRRF